MNITSVPYSAFRQSFEWSVLVRFVNQPHRMNWARYRYLWHLAFSDDTRTSAVARIYLLALQTFVIVAFIIGIGIGARL